MVVVVCPRCDGDLIYRVISHGRAMAYMILFLEFYLGSVQHSFYTLFQIRVFF